MFRGSWALLLAVGEIPVGALRSNWLLAVRLCFGTCVGCGFGLGSSDSVESESDWG